MSAVGPVGEHVIRNFGRDAGGAVAGTSAALARDEDAEPATPASALERLAATRAQLRAALQAQHAPQRPTAGAKVHPSVLSGAASDWLAHLKSQPGVQLVVAAVQSWWVQHPLRTASLVAGEAAKTLAQPLAQRHPIALVLGAAALGGALVWSRPWRWLLKPTLLAGLLPQLASKVVTQLPLQSWLAVLTSLLQSKPQAPAQTEVAKRKV
jgi:hypothetical protein